MNDQALQQVMEDRNVAAIADAFFDTDIHTKPGQQEIVESIAFDDHLRIIITAPTRYGKTYAVALGTAIYLLLHKNRTVYEIAPKLKQSRKFRQYLVDFILDCPPLRKRLDVNATGAERIRKEVSKRRITFSDGNEIQIETAGGSDTAQSLMGEGGDLIILDESCDIEEEVWRKRVSRMLGDSPDAKLVEIGNPWRKDNHFFKHWNSDRFHTIQIDWRQAVNEGRLQENFIEEQRRELTDMEFKILYDAQFPDQVEGGLINYSWIEEAQKRSFAFDDDIKVAGLDVANEGGAWNVLTIGYVEGNHVKVERQEAWEYGNPMTTTGKAAQYLRGHEVVNVDAIGIGAGVVARLKERGFTANAVNVGKSPDREKDRFVSRKAQYYWKLRSLFEDGRIDIPQGGVDTMTKQLVKMRWEPTSSEKIKVLDPSGPSPDHADSLMLMASRTSRGGETAGVSLM